MKKIVITSLCSLICFLIKAQNVGIGTVIPSEKLHVAGNIKADTLKPNAIKFLPNAGLGKLLTSDAAGNASWQNGLTAGNVGFGPWGDCSVNNISEYNPVTDPTGAAGDNFGARTAISGNFAIVGAYGDDVGANIDQGSASIFQFNGTNWVLMQKITDATGAAGDFFGVSVAISGNYAIIGAFTDDVGANADQGSASIYQYNGTSWVLMQKITDATGAAGDNFGVSVSINGNYALVGSYKDDVGANTDQGSACVFQYNGSVWGIYQKLTDAAGAVNDFFGINCCIYGNYILIGESAYDVGANTDQGAALIYHFNNVSWVPTQKITDATGIAGANFGAAVSISGAYLIIGAFLDGTPTNTGSASVYQFNGSSWVLMQKLQNTNKAPGDFFGTSVSLSGNYAIVGAFGTTINGNLLQGCCTIYSLIGQGWKKLQYVTDPGGNASDNFGINCCVDGTTKRFLIGANGYGLSSGNVLFGKIN